MDLEKLQKSDISLSSKISTLNKLRKIKELYFSISGPALMGQDLTRLLIEALVFLLIRLTFLKTELNCLVQPKNRDYISVFSCLVNCSSTRQGGQSSNPTFYFWRIRPGTIYPCNLGTPTRAVQAVTQRILSLP